MKKLCVLLLCIILMVGLLPSGIGEERPPLPQAVMALCQQYYPEHTLSQHSGFGDEQQGQWALVLSKDGNHILAIAEKDKTQPAYRFTIENPNALMPGDSRPSVLIDTGRDALFFGFSKDNDRWSFNASKSEAGWGEVGLILYSHLPGSEEYYETLMIVQEGLLFFDFLQTDGNENIEERYCYPPIPVPHLVGKIGIAEVDWAAFPTRPADWLESYSQPNPDVLRALTPMGWTFYEAQINLGGIHLLGQDEQGQTRLLLKRWLANVDNPKGGFYQDTVSAPLPEGIRVQAKPLGQGVSLYLDEQSRAFSFACDRDNVWRLSFVMAQDWYTITPHYVSLSSSEDNTFYFGTFSESDIRDIQLANIPSTFEEIKLQLDQSGWAKVNNPNPADRLHLREQPDRGSASLGKFYNGTPVQVLERKGAWARVQLAGLSGWMMADYLAIGVDMNQVQPAFPGMVGLDRLEMQPMPLYARPDEHSLVIEKREITHYVPYWIVGVVEDGWYYVYFFQEDIGGFMKQEWFWSGNG